jgi:hypothetical protein
MIENSSNIKKNIENLLVLVNQIPNFRNRQRPLKYPNNKVPIKIDYSFANVNFMSFIFTLYLSLSLFSLQLKKVICV